MDDRVTSERCIECEELELARVHDELPIQTLPVPVAALEGLPEGRDSGSLTRRRLLQSGIAGFAAVYGSRVLGFEEVFEAAVAQAAPSDQNVVVLLYLAGGNDGLNVITPGTANTADWAAYAGARPTIGRVQGASTLNPDGTVARSGTVDLPGTDGSLAIARTVLSQAGGGDPLQHATLGLDALFGDGSGGAGSDLAVLPAVDYTPANLSHFDSSDYWFAGNLSGMTTGWLGRWIDRNGSDSNPLQAVSIDQALSKAIRTAVNPVCAMASTSSLGFSMNTTGGYTSPPGTTHTSNINAVMDDLAGVAAAEPNLYLARSRSAYDLAVAVAGHGPTISGQPNTAIGYPTGTLGNRLKLAAKIIKAGLGTRVITIHWGSFDTHGSQINGQDPQLRTLSHALAAFRADLQARGVEDRVVTVGFSEFGRRVDENGSAGTDHGAGGLMFLSGSSVRGGLASEFPGCEASEIVNGNLKVTTDFRSVYQSVLTEWLGGDLTGVLPGGAFPAIQRYDGGNSLFK